MNALPKIVQQRMRAGTHPQEHPSAELLAAFSDGAITPVERGQMLAHLSLCSECRQVIFLSHPELEIGTAVARTAPRNWFQVPALRWAAAAACVVVIGGGAFLAHEQHSNHAEPTSVALVSGSTTAATATQEKAPAPTEPAFDATQRVAEAQNSAPSHQAANTVTARPAQIAGAEGFASLGPSRYSAVASSLPRWTLTSSGTLQRSLDSGKTWQRVEIPGNNATLHAVAAVGPYIWVGGSGGTLYYSLDAGRKWSKINAVANGAKLSEDVIAIAFTGDRNGQLRTSSGEVWTTADGGSTWQMK